MSDITVLVLGFGFVLVSGAWFWLATTMKTGVETLSKDNENLRKQLLVSGEQNQKLQNKLSETNAKLTEFDRENKILQEKLSETNTKLDSCTNALSA